MSRDLRRPTTKHHDGKCEFCPLTWKGEIMAIISIEINFAINVFARFIAARACA